MNENMFVMWDKAIREHYYTTRRYSPGGDGYIDFLKEMQVEGNQVIDDYKHLGLSGTPYQFISNTLNYPLIKTLAKYIDEFNWIKFTKKIAIPPNHNNIEILKFLLSNTYE